MSGLTEASKIEMMEMLKQIMEKMKENQRSLMEGLQSVNETLDESNKKLNENLQSLKEDNQSMRKSLCKKWDDCQKDLRESISRSEMCIRDRCKTVFVGIGVHRLYL